MCEIFDTPDDSYWFYQELLKYVIDCHAPLKKKIVKHSQVPYMNGCLRRAINVKNMLKREFYKYPSNINWEKYLVE